MPECKDIDSLSTDVNVQFTAQGRGNPITSNEIVLNSSIPEKRRGPLGQLWDAVVWLAKDTQALLSQSARQVRPPPQDTSLKSNISPTNQLL